jgi:hypothetical protein
LDSKSFCYWLQGYFELSDSKTLSEKQVECIKNHMKLVFFHEIDPSYTDDVSKQGEMQAIHDGNTSLKPGYSHNRRGGQLVVKC